MMNGSSSAINFSGLTNQAVLSVQHGTLQIQSSHLNLQSSETLDVGMSSQADYGKLNLVSAVPLTGAFQVTLNGGYMPVATNSFAVVSYPSLSGSFSSFILPNLLPQSRLGPRLWRHHLDFGAPTAHCDTILREQMLSSASMAHRGIRPSC